MNFNVEMEGVVFKVVTSSDEYGIEIEEIYAPGSSEDISYFMDAWMGEILNDIMRQLGEAAMAAEEESFINVNR